MWARSDKWQRKCLRKCRHVFLRSRRVVPQPVRGKPGLRRVQESMMFVSQNTGSMRSRYGLQLPELPVSSGSFGRAETCVTCLITCGSSISKCCHCRLTLIFHASEKAEFVGESTAENTACVENPHIYLIQPVRDANQLQQLSQVVPCHVTQVLRRW